MSISTPTAPRSVTPNLRLQRERPGNLVPISQYEAAVQRQQGQVMGIVRENFTRYADRVTGAVRGAGPPA